MSALLPKADISACTGRIHEYAPSLVLPGYRWEPSARVQESDHIFRASASFVVCAMRTHSSARGRHSSASIGTTNISIFFVSEPALADLFPFQMVLFFRCLGVQSFSQLHPSLCDPLELFREIGR